MSNLKRKCIVTHQVKDVKELIRVVKLPNGKFEVNSESQGRGAYVTKDITLVDKIISNRLLNRAFKTPIPNEVYEKLRKEMEV